MLFSLESKVCYLVHGKESDEQEPHHTLARSYVPLYSHC